MSVPAGAGPGCGAGVFRSDRVQLPKNARRITFRGRLTTYGELQHATGRNDSTTPPRGRHGRVAGSAPPGMQSIGISAGSLTPDRGCRAGAVTLFDRPERARCPDRISTRPRCAPQPTPSVLAMAEVVLRIR